MDKISYTELLEAIQHLPQEEAEMLQQALQKNLTQKRKNVSAKKRHQAFQELLLSAPTMSTEQYRKFMEERKHFNEWK